MSYVIKAGDTKPLRATLTQGTGAPVPLTGASVVFRMKNVSTAAVITGACTITSASKGRVMYTWASTQTDTVGVYRSEFTVTYADGKTETIPNPDTESIEIKARQT